MEFDTLLYVYGMAIVVLIVPTLLVVMFILDRQAARRPDRALGRAKTRAHVGASASTGSSARPF